jgi:hypothetical protein
MDLSWIATPNGLVRVKTLKKGDKLASYNFNATCPDNVLVKTSVTKIEKHFADSVFNIYIPGDRCIGISPQQIVFAAKKIADQEFDARFDIELIQAQYLTTDHMLIDINMNLIPIVGIIKVDFYIEETYQKRSWFKKKNCTSVTRFEKTDMYSIELEEPHIFLIPACLRGVNPQKDPDVPLILMHNGAAELSLGFAFGASVASVSFSEATVTACGLSVALGPAGLAVGATAGIGYFLYNIFSNNKDKLYLERSDSAGSNVKNDPKDDKKSGEAQAPGKPTKEDGYVPPKRWDGKKMRHQKTGKTGWPDEDGNVWVPTGPGSAAHGGPHWDVQFPKTKNGRDYKNVYPGGKVR